MTRRSRNIHRNIWRRIPPERRLSKKLRDFVWRRDRGRCVYCGARPRRKSWFRKEVKLEFGHFIAFSRGGHNCADNIQLECRSCNRRKGVRTKEVPAFNRWVRGVGCRGCRGECGR